MHKAGVVRRAYAMNRVKTHPQKICAGTRQGGLGFAWLSSQHHMWNIPAGCSIHTQYKTWAQQGFQFACRATEPTLSATRQF